MSSQKAKRRKIKRVREQQAEATRLKQSNATVSVLDLKKLEELLRNRQYNEAENLHISSPDYVSFEILASLFLDQNDMKKLPI
jgi:hypothetical protein